MYSTHTCTLQTVFSSAVLTAAIVLPYFYYHYRYNSHRSTNIRDNNNNHNEDSKKKQRKKKKKQLQRQDFDRLCALYHVKNKSSNSSSSSSDHYWIYNVRIPIAVLSSSIVNKNCNGDKEGLILCHIQISLRDGVILDVRPATATATATTTTTAMIRATNVNVADAHGCIMMPCFVDVHTHLIKTQTIPRTHNTTGTWNEALYQIEPQEMSNHWNQLQDVQRRMEFGIQCALHYGTKALRTHLDGCDNDNNNAPSTVTVMEVVYQAYENLIQKYDTIMTLQGVANLYLPLWLQEPLATQHANRAAQHTNVVLGAYVGNATSTEEININRQAMKALFFHAQRLDNMDVDLHIDESNDPKCCNLKLLIEVLQHAQNNKENGYQGRVVLGHCCSLSLQGSTTQTEICQQLAELKNCHVVANPFTNLALQDRRGSEKPQCQPIPSTIARTPQWRGMTLVQELQNVGVNVSMASDNVRDYWYFYGDYDLLATWSFGIQMGHLDTIPSAGAWLDLISDAPAKAMGLLSSSKSESNSATTTTTTTKTTISDVQNACSIDIGQIADIVFFPSARRISELLARPQTNRIILRKGKLLDPNLTILPDFDTLDDLDGMSFV